MSVDQLVEVSTNVGVWIPHCSGIVDSRNPEIQKKFKNLKQTQVSVILATPSLVFSTTLRYDKGDQVKFSPIQHQIILKFVQICF